MGRTAQGAESGAGVITLRGVGKSYKTQAGDFEALADIHLTFAAGEFAAIVGKSGSGKSTLINLLTGIDHPSLGEITVAAEQVTGKSESQLAQWRGRNVGIVFQFFQLLPTLTIAENVMLPMDLCGTFAGKRRERALGLLARVGIESQADKFPSSLSGGQQQRAAIARALANGPPLLVADEPTGNLDTRTSADVLALFRDLARAGTTVIIVSHERDIASIADRTVVLEDGRVTSDSLRASRPFAVPAE
ncbi:MAG: ABC transporter ATP-binding protein [Devosia sp.]